MANSLAIIGAAIANALVAKAVTPTMPLDHRGWWHSVIREPFTGAWQRNLEIRNDNILIHQAVYSCITLIASDIAKCRLRLVEMDGDGIWKETFSSAFSGVLNEPNRYQNMIQFIEYWMISKLVEGNTYVLKAWDGRGVVSSLYILDPKRTRARVAPDGAIYYELRKDNLSGIEDETVLVPASYIIHDMMTMKHHPLCGIPPLAPAALAAEHSLNIQRNASKFFNGGSLPSGVLTAPAGISTETATRAKQFWEQTFGGGDNVGKIVALGDGLKFEPMAFKAIDSQLIEQLQMSAKMVCTSFSVPPHKVHVGDPPSFDNISALNQQYYSDCIQKHMESIERLLDKGLGLLNVQDKVYGTEFDKDDLFSMDSATQFKAMAEGVRGGFIAPDEARKKFNYSPVPGGKSPMMQHQDYSLEALAKRDAKPDPFESVGRAPAALPPPAPAERALSDLEISALKQKFAWRLQSALEKTGGMIMEDRLLDALADSIVPVMRNYTAKATADLSTRVKEEVARAISELPVPRDGKDADLDIIKLMVQDEVLKIPTPADGKSITQDDVRPLLEELIAAIPKPQDGEKGEPGEAGPAGKDADPDLLQRALTEITGLKQTIAAMEATFGEELRQLSARPTPPSSFLINEAGELVAVSPGGETKSIGVVRGNDGDRGASVMDGSVDDDGLLVLRMSDGRILNAGIVRGENGRDGAPGGIGPAGRDSLEMRPLPGIDESKSYSEGVCARYRGGLIRAERQTDPIENGDIIKAGWGVILEGIAEERENALDGGRIMERTTIYTGGRPWTRRQQTEMAIYRGIWKEGSVYQRGDTATRSGATWHCEQETSERPGAGSTHWKMCVKAGQDGRDGKPGPQGVKGMDGRPGRDLTHTTPDGGKY